MVKIQDGVVHLQTGKTSYILSTQRFGLPENLYYGKKISLLDNDVSALYLKREAGFGTTVKRQKDQPALSTLALDLSPYKRGDYRQNAIIARMGSGARTSDFTFTAASILEGSAAPQGEMPMGHGGDKTLALCFSGVGGLTVELFYTVFFHADVITKKIRISNHSAGKIMLERCFSQQLDLPTADFDLFTLNGAWAREGHVVKRPLATGTQSFGNNTGVSGNECNPFFFLAKTGAGEQEGEVYGFNLVYSGSHEGLVQVDSFGQTRVLHGVASEGFSWPLDMGESFVTPEAVLTFSCGGKNGMSQNMHNFVKNHIIPARWNNRQRPVLFNNWEGTYFNFTEKKIVSMAKTAKELGAELFVLDDGWFGARNNDNAGLGDYDVNMKKLPSGMGGLAQEIRKIGLDFGLWFEPEMVNEDSDLFRQHPDWIVATPGFEPCTGRQQYVLDLCREDVREYIINSVNKVLDSAEISYVKWDMNRHISDDFSVALKDQGAFAHSYVLGLYKLFDGICRAHPQILFEGCASGGNRFDLGILAYMPQIWTSDDTDAHERQKIQTGISYGYPLCTMGAHVSATPNHQTLRITPLETRFNTAAFGVLGYELDPRRLTAHEKQDVKAQIEYYKKHRDIFQFGEFFRIDSPFEGDACTWMAVSADKKRAVVGDYISLIVPNKARKPLRLVGLEESFLYKTETRPQKIAIKVFGDLINHVLPFSVNKDGVLVHIANKFYRLETEKKSYTAYGDLLCGAGLRLMQDFSGSGYSKDMRLMQDFSSRLYSLEKVEEIL